MFTNSLETQFTLFRWTVTKIQQDREAIEKVRQLYLYITFQTSFTRGFTFINQANRLRPSDNEVSTQSNECSFSRHFYPKRQLVYLERKFIEQQDVWVNIDRCNIISLYCLKYILYGLKNHSKWSLGERHSNPLHQNHQVYYHRKC